MGKTIRTSALVLLLACSAQAGYIQNGSPASHPPNAVTVEQTADGYMQNDEPDSLTESVLSVLESVLSLF